MSHKNIATNIIMNHAKPPSAEELQQIATSILSTLPSDFADLTKDTTVTISDLADETLTQDLDLDDAFELSSFYDPQEKILHLYRRSILDLWCEEEIDLSTLLIQIIVSEVCQSKDIEEDETDRHINDTEAQYFALHG